MCAMQKQKPLNNKPPLLEVENLTAGFTAKKNKNSFRGIFTPKEFFPAVDNISFSITAGRSLGLVGESGAGKTTAALAIARLIAARSGKVMLDGEDIMPLSGKSLTTARRKMQMIFQDPYAALDPRRTLIESVAEPLRHLTETDAATRSAIIDDVFKSVGLGDEHHHLYPHHLSGGQRQRIGIARALASAPALVICDEPVSMLDVAVAAQILNLLRRLQIEKGLTYLFISHDLGAVQYLCDDIAVMAHGRIVEHAPAEKLIANPRHPETKRLLEASRLRRT